MVLLEKLLKCFGGLILSFIQAVYGRAVKNIGRIGWSRRHGGYCGGFQGAELTLFYSDRIRWVTSTGQDKARHIYLYASIHPYIYTHIRTYIYLRNILDRGMQSLGEPCSNKQPACNGDQIRDSLPTRVTEASPPFKSPADVSPWPTALAPPTRTTLLGRSPQCFTGRPINSMLLPHQFPEHNRRSCGDDVLVRLELPLPHRGKWWYASTGLERARATTRAIHSPFSNESQRPTQNAPTSDMSRSQTGQDMAARTENETAPPRKRQKIGLACEECRSRKVRCDGLRPECSACKRREKVCIYLTESSKLSGSRRYVPLGGVPTTQEKSQRLTDSPRALHSLHDRVACLEAKAKGETAPRRLSENLTSGTGLDERLPLKQSSHAVNADLSPPQSQQCDTDSIVVEPHQTLSHPQPHPCAVSSISGTSKDAARDVDSLSSNQDMGALSAMGIALLATEATNDATREFYGEPSAASLLCDIEDHRQQRPSRPQPHCQDSAPQPSPPSSRRSFSVPYPSNPDDYHLPPRHMADSLLDIYRERVQIIYPFLHWQTFMEAYHRLWLSNSEVKSMPQLTGVGLGGPRCPVPVFYCALNAAFALATQFTDGSAQERKERSAPFVRRSRHLMRLDFLDATDISMVQALLILARYLQSTSLPTRCWNVAGIAYRMAQGLGLHITVDERSPSKLDIEMRRRVWHSCACLETYEENLLSALGMLTGRPGSNSTTSKVPLPNISDQDISTYTPVGSDHSDNDVPTATFFAQAIKLNHILNRILSHIYDPWKEHAASMQIELDDVKQYAEQVSSTISFDHELNRFETRLPEALRWSTDKSKLHGGNDLAQQRHVLRSR
ncbi:Trans-enoyl reductase fsdC [Fusarium oxysporum f. sp. albedinis]|nr:Trans-enoyl reductase fsdC [Fusarium oxysporum f. sp. albedinis]